MLSSLQLCYNTVLYSRDMYVSTVVPAVRYGMVLYYYLLVVLVLVPVGYGKYQVPGAGIIHNK